jgi:hypothetical protein
MAHIYCQFGSGEKQESAAPYFHVEPPSPEHKATDIFYETSVALESLPSPWKVRVCRSALWSRDLSS